MHAHASTPPTELSFESENDLIILIDTYIQFLGFFIIVNGGIFRESSKSFA